MLYWEKFVNHLCRDLATIELDPKDPDWPKNMMSIYEGCQRDHEEKKGYMNELRDNIYESTNSCFEDAFTWEKKSERLDNMD